MRSHFGKYQVVELIGEGGFGQVFKGLDPDLRRPVAIKTCSLQQADMRERFFKEAEIAARLQHPNITTVYDFGKLEGEPYLVQEYLTGQDLDAIIHRGDPIPLAFKLRILLQIAEGLRYAHSRGVIHRDVKPANMRVLEDGQLRIMDFGIARLVEETQRLTQVGMTLGTAGYLSPEQLLGLEIDQRSDIFSFGVLAYELVTYRAPFQADSISALFYAIAHEDPPPAAEIWSECPPALAACLNRCLAKDREARYRDFAEVMADLRAVLAPLESGQAALAATAVGMAVGAPGAAAPPRGATITLEGAAPPAVERPAARSRPPAGGGRRARQGLWGLAGVALLVAVFEIARWAMPGESSTVGEGGFGSLPPQGDPAAAGGGAPVPSTEGQAPPGASPEARPTGGNVPVAPGGEVSGPGRGAAGAAPSAGAPITAPPGGQPSATPPVRPVQATPAEAAARADTHYRGTTTLVLFWSGGGHPGSATTAENAFLDELSRRGMAVVEAGLLSGIHADAAAMAMAQGLDARAVAALGREYGAQVVVVGSLRTEAELSAGRFFTGRAVLDLRSYSASATELLGTSTQQVGVGGTPGKLGPSPLAAEAEAAREAGRLAAAQVARDFGEVLPRRR